jgi:hypothetical protein
LVGLTQYSHVVIHKKKEKLFQPLYSGLVRNGILM